MINAHFQGITGPKVYRDLLKTLLEYPEPHVVGGVAMHNEIVGCSLFIADANTLDFDIAGRPSNRAYKYTEALWDLGPSDEMYTLERVNPKVHRFVENQPQQSQYYATWAYGPQIHAELFNVATMLLMDPASRQAVISIPRSSRTIGTPPCLCSIQFLLRNEKLHAVVHMRSNDIWLGVPLDLFQFNLMQQLVAAYICADIGTYTHYVGSMHLYERDVEAAKKVVQRGLIEDIVYPCFRYSKGDLLVQRSGYLHRDLKYATLGMMPENINVYSRSIQMMFATIVQHQAEHHA